MHLFQGIVKKNIDYCLRGINEPFSFSSAKLERPQCIEETRALQEEFMTCIATVQVDVKWQHILLQKKVIKKRCRWKLDLVKDVYTHPGLNDFLLVSQDLDLLWK